MATELVPYKSTLALERAEAWARLSDGEQKRQAVDAAQRHDAIALWTITENWLLHNGARGGRVSQATLTRYRSALVPRDAASGSRLAKGQPLLEAWAQENLLHPGRRAATSWRASLQASGCEPATVQIYLTAGRRLYDALRATGATDATPFSDVRAPRDPTPAFEKAHLYTENELTRLLAVARDDDRLLVVLGGHTGLRVSEMTALRWRAIRFDRSELVVEHGKGGRMRTVGLSETALLELSAQRRNGDDYVLPYNGTSAFNPIDPW